MSQTPSDTLRIVDLPLELSNERREELMKRFGAVACKTIRKSKRHAVTFAKFPSKQIAQQAFLRLHQLEVKGKYLSVKFATGDVNVDSSSNEPGSLDTNSSEINSISSERRDLTVFLSKLNGWANNRSFTQPPPPNIKYNYPKPTRSTVQRIAFQLLKEPAFYTQVLHLMNRMNLPPPFEGLDEMFPWLKDVYGAESCNDIFGVRGEIKEDERLVSESEEESEWESEEDADKGPKEIIPVKRKLGQSSRVVKKPKFVNPAKVTTAARSNKPPVKPEEIFEPVKRDESKNLRIELKTADVQLGSDNPIPDAEQSEGGFGLIHPIEKTAEAETKLESDCITTEELAANRLSQNDQRVLQVFKNYHPGKPSSRLYIKNLAKQVESRDLHLIFKRFVLPNLENPENQFEVRLMQEGRMKGQAFVTLQNVEQAQRALEETNGYILKDKPMVVHFAKVNK